MLENVVQVFLLGVEESGHDESKNCDELLKVVLQGCTSKEDLEVGRNAHQLAVAVRLGVPESMSFVIDANRRSQVTEESVVVRLDCHVVSGHNHIDLVEVLLDVVLQCWPLSLRSIVWHNV